MPDEDDELEVNVIDTSVLDEEVEIVLRSDLSSMIALLNTLNLGLATIRGTPRHHHRGWQASAAASVGVLDVLHEELYRDELDDIPEGGGFREATIEEMKEAVDVNVRWLGGDGD